MTFTKVTNTGIGSTGTVLLQNLDVIGIVTAGFGVSTVDVFTTGVSTFSGVTNITNTTDSTSSTTGALIVTGGVGIAASLNVGGSVSVGGTLTYEDVTNVDSVGIITARSNILVGSGITLSPDGHAFVAGVSTIGTLSVSGIVTATGDVDPSTGTITSSGDVNIGTGGKLVISGNSAVKDIQYGDGTTTGYFRSNTNVNRTNADAAIHTQQFRWNNTKVAEIKAITGDDTTNKDNGHITFETAAAGTTGERLRIAADGNIGIGTAGPTSLLHLAAGGGGNVIELQRNSNNTTGNIGAINFTAFDGHSVANMGAYGDGDNEGAYINFKTTSAASANSPFTSTTERLRIGSAGQIGIAGANYGSDNQALTSQGSSASVEWRGINTPAWDADQTSVNNIPTSTWTLVGGLVENVDTDGAFTSSTFTVPAGAAGTYYIFGQATIDDIQADDFVLSGIVVNAAQNGNDPQLSRRGGFGCSGGANERVTSYVNIITTLAVGDQVRLAVYHNEGTTEPTEEYYTRFGGFRLSV